jgi:pyruvate formate lyase activating enzyme
MDFPIKGFLETSFVDWPGKIASVVFLPRCNFRCPYCHNYELVIDHDQFPTVPFDHIIEKLRYYRGWIDGVCITGGEPTLLPALPELITRIKQEQMLIKLDTNGSHPHVLKSLINAHLVDYIAMDVKAPLDRKSYARCCGVAVDLAQILESVNLLRENLIPYEFRVTVAPTFLDGDDLMRLAHQIKGARRLILQQFSPVHTLDPRCRQIAPYGESHLRMMQEEVSGIIRGNLQEYQQKAPLCLQAG